VPTTSSRHFLYPKNGGRKFSEMFVPINPTQRRQNSEDRGHQTHHPDELKHRKQNLKNKTDGVFACNLCVTRPPLVGCPSLLVHYVRKKMKTA
jgi:hypothetical protein